MTQSTGLTHLSSTLTGGCRWMASRILQFILSLLLFYMMNSMFLSYLCMISSCHCVTVIQQLFRHFSDLTDITCPVPQTASY